MLSRNPDVTATATRDINRTQGLAALVVPTRVILGLACRCSPFGGQVTGMQRKVEPFEIPGGRVTGHRPVETFA